MAPSDNGRVPIVIDLTLDSDSDNAYDESLPTRTVSATSKIAAAPLPPTFRSSNVPRPVVAGSLTTPASLPGGSFNDQSWRPVSAYLQGTRTPVGTNTLASSSRPLAIPNSANMGGGNAPSWKSYVPTPSTTPSSGDGLKGADRSAKRRKLSTPLRREAEHSGTQTQPLGHINGKQPNRHGITASTQTQNVLESSQPANWGGVRLSTMNRAPLVHHISSELKPNSSSISYLDNARTQAPRSLLTSRLTKGDITTGLPSPGLTTPESVSVIVIDSDSLDGNESDMVSTSPAVNDARQASSIKFKNPNRFQDHADASDENTRTAILQAPQSSRSSSLLEPAPPHGSENDDMKSVFSNPLLARQTIPQIVHQAPTPLHAPERASSPAPAIIKPLQTNEDGATEESDHLILFLKEVKGFRWADIATEFAKEFPRRTRKQLQTYYSRVLSKRDRTQDPVTLKLPARFAAEATVDWQTVLTNTVGSRIRAEVASLSLNDAPQLDRQQFGRSHAFYHARDHDDSSGTDSAPQRQRPRRAAPVNYTWSKLRTTEGGPEEEISEEKFAVSLDLNREMPTHSESPTDDTLVVSDSSTETHKPLEKDHHADARLSLATRTDLYGGRKERIPYMSASQRQTTYASPEDWTWDQRIGQDWQGAILHVDFSPAELQIVENVVAKAIQSARQTRHSTYRRHLRAILKGLAEPRLQQMAHEISRHLHSRDAQSIRSFLNDAAAGKVSDVPQIQRLAMVKPSPGLSSIQQPSISTVVRQRELGLQSRRGWKAASTPLTYQIQNQMADTLGPRYTWTGASSDVHTVAWSPAGQYFAAGAVAVTDIDSMQYNRPNNLLYVDTTNGVIQELGGHCVDRPKTRAGANSTHAMYVSQDPKLYTTVSSVAFSPSGRLMYSAGYDQSVCIWEASAGNTRPQLTRQLQHKAPVDILAVNQHCNGLIATAAKRTTDKSIKLVYFDEETVNDQEWHHTRWDFASAKAINRPDFKMTANALQFSPTDGTLLLAGFSANVREDNGLDTTGDICLWDVNTQRDLHVHGSSRNVFDVTFNPDPRVHSLLAVGCVASGNVNRGTRSVVRFYTTNGAKDGPNKKFICPLELECTAYDMNDIVWCPHDENLFAAGCTDGCSYVWDLRKPDKVLYTLSHGPSLMPLQDDVPHDRTDTGVRFLSWGQNATRLYSGSSDGIVKVWDVTRSQEDTFVRNLVTTDSGIMSGALSPDYSKLVLGEVNGSVNVLEVGRDDVAIRDAEKLQYYPYHDKDNEDEETSIFDANSRTSTNTVAAEAQHWLETGQLKTAPMGGFPKNQVIQGPNYKGPFDRSEDAHTHALRKQAFLFQRRVAAAKGPQCDLPACLDSVSTTTYEEVGDSGRSVDRIPDELRQQWLDENVRIVPGKSKCTHCGRPALPSTDLRKGVFCERCSFTCFRCGWESELAGLATIFNCPACGGAWSVGALGYEYDQACESIDRPLDIPPLDKFAQETYLERSEDADTTFGDEMNALTDYYFGMALNQPGSPLL